MKKIFSLLILLMFFFVGCSDKINQPEENKTTIYEFSEDNLSMESNIPL